MITVPAGMGRAGEDETALSAEAPVVQRVRITLLCLPERIAQLTNDSVDHTPANASNGVQHEWDVHPVNTERIPRYDHLSQPSFGTPA